LVIVFAAPTDENTAGTGVRATEQSPDGLLSAQRTQLAARAVRDRFGESNVAEAILYIADSSVFVRAVQEAKVQLKDPASPSEADRLALGKAIGAVSVITVRAQSVKDKPGSVEVVLDSTDVESGKTWSDKIAAGGSVLATLPGQISVGDGTTKQTPVDNTAWMTVSNTLVLRYLAGPLGEYTRALPPPGMVNIPKPAPQTDPITLAAPTPPATAVPAPVPSATPLPGPTVFPTSPTTSPVVTPTTPLVLSSAASIPVESSLTAQNVAAQAARQQADALIASGDVNSAIVVLRKAVNLAPRSLPLRVSLAKAYLSAGRTNDAAAEARRALTVIVPDSDREAWAEMTRVLASASTEIGDNKTARASYEEVLKTQPQAHWARLALGDLFLAQGDTAAAEKEYRTVRQADPKSRDAILSVARVLIARGDFNGAIAEVSTSNSSAGTPQERLAITSVLFDEIAAKTADSVAQNRQAFDGGQLSREAFFKATEAQSARVDSLLTLLRSAAPAAGSAEGVTSVYHRRISAAALLSQAVGSMLTFLESDDKKAGEQAKLLLTEFRKELTAASG
jgi:tetratricopeptide (TPR) repeat protein